MQIFGLGTVVSFILSLAFFLLAFSNPDWMRIGFAFGALFFIIAAAALAMMVKGRWKTEKT